MAAGAMSTADYLTDGILALIRDGNRQPGDRLPSVDELAASFGVAAPTVREVLRRLEATGALEIRHGSGIYVCRTVQAMVVVNPHGEAVDAQSLRNLLQARLLIEPVLARMAAERLDPETTALLESSLARAAAVPASDPQATHEGGLGVHRVIARASGNAILADIINSLLDVHAREQLQLHELYGSPQRDVVIHAEIVLSITSGDAARAEALMEDHLGVVQATVLERLAVAAADSGRADEIGAIR